MNNNWEKGCDFGFKVGQKAWHNRYGWGMITMDLAIKTYAFKWVSDCQKYFEYFMADGCLTKDDLTPTIFHVEQTFDYSRPKWQPEPGELCWVWNDGWQVPNTRVFSYFADDAYWCRTTCGDNEMPYTYCAPFNGGKLPEQFAHLLKGGSDES